MQRRQHAAVGAEGDIIDRLHGEPVGLNDMAAASGEECGSIEDAIEPYLIQQGCAQRTPRRRIAILTAYRRPGAAPPAATSGIDSRPSLRVRAVLRDPESTPESGAWRSHGNSL